VPGKALVEECVVAIQQIEHTAVITQDALKKQFGLAADGVTQIVVKFGEHIRVGRHLGEIAQLQPLAREVLDQGVRTRIVEHAAHLAFENLGRLQLAGIGQVEQFVVWNAAPEKEG